MQYSKVFAFSFIFTSSDNLINMASTIWSNDKKLWHSSGRPSKMCEFHSTPQLPDIICNSEDASFPNPIEEALLHYTCWCHSPHWHWASSKFRLKPLLSFCVPTVHTVTQCCLLNIYHQDHYLRKIKRIYVLSHGCHHSSEFVHSTFTGHVYWVHYSRCVLGMAGHSV